MSRAAMLGYSGTVGGYKQFGRPELLKAAFTGQTVAEHANRVQRGLSKASGQDRVRRVLNLVKGGAA